MEAWVGKDGFLRYHLYFLSNPPATNPRQGGAFTLEACPILSTPD